MAVEDYLESEVGIAIAATAVVLSPQVRGYLRRGAVYVLAGGIKMGDAVVGAAQGLSEQAQHINGNGANGNQETTHDSAPAARNSKSRQAKVDA